MLDPRTLDFLRNLSRNNNKEWYKANRDAYNRAHDDVVRAAGVLIDRADEYDARVTKREKDPAKCLTRLRRDPRFAREKPPYKTELIIMINSNAVREETAGYFFHVEPGNCYAGASYYITQSERLSRVRDRIVERYDEWLEIMNHSTMRTVFPQGLESPSTLKTIPRGYDRDHPAADYLRMKGFRLHHALTDSQAVRSDAVDIVVNALRTARPFVDFINSAFKER